MSIIVNDNIQANAPKILDNRYSQNGVTPYISVAQANASIPITYRAIGLTVNVAGVEYWYQSGTANANLVIKGASVGSGTLNRIAMWTPSGTVLGNSNMYQGNIADPRPNSTAVGSRGTYIIGKQNFVDSAIDCFVAGYEINFNNGNECYWLGNRVYGDETLHYGVAGMGFANTYSNACTGTYLIGDSNTFDGSGFGSIIGEQNTQNTANYTTLLGLFNYAISTDSMIIAGVSNGADATLNGVMVGVNNYFDNANDFVVVGIGNTNSGATNCTVIGSNNSNTAIQSDNVFVGQNDLGITITSTGNGGIGTYTPTAKWQIQGINNLVGTFALITQNASLSNLFTVRNNGRINMGLLPTSNVGLSAGDLWNNLGIINIV